ncbi:hypothetical protein EGH22_05985 [Halomicroarcula sp. F28]|uniref:hypothetical protein n=1 Tax=Haloarcula salinisoli TaxID=2487746 RepID=UPI001C729FF1|nr:hypothetical protein [Halomicroarcula salinisoli]MBX0285866.1 hypothetical protein [Halomicroarcula salinisoli]
MDVDRLSEWQHFVVGIGLVVLTFRLTEPGADSVTVGPVDVDIFYFTVLSSLTLVALSGHGLWTMYTDR